MGSTGATPVFDSMSCNSDLGFNYSELNSSYFISVSTQNTSSYFECCWMMIDPKEASEAVKSKNPKFIYSLAQSTISGVLAMLLSIVGAVLNFLVMCAIRRSKNLRKEYLTPSILCLSVLDFIFSVYILSLRSLLGFMRDLPMFLTGGCDIYGFVAFGLFQGSVFNLLGISTFRFIAVTFPNISQTNRFQRACKIAPPTIVILGLFNLLPILTRYNGRFGFECKTFTCRVVNVDVNGEPISTDPFAVFSGIIMLCGIFLMILNIATYAQVRRKTNQIVSRVKEANKDAGLKLLQKERRLGKVIAVLTASFFIVYSPHIILHAIHQHAEVTHTTATAFTLFFTFSLVVIDPAIYILGHKKYQMEIRRLLKPYFGKRMKFFDVPDHSRGSIQSRVSKHRSSPHQKTNRKFSTVPTLDSPHQTTRRPLSNVPKTIVEN